jgi:bifunctional DNA-binding transcriptional regulator/antitoxin component of YhaV-PrlF toxin-antitoxin module
MDDGESERELLEYLYFVKCDEVGVDETGRFVLPPAAREKLGLDGEALFQGKGRKFHILKPDDGAAADDKVLKMLEKFGEGKEFFNPISLANKRRVDPADVEPMTRARRPICPSCWGDLAGGQPDFWRVARWHLRRWWLRPWIA